MTPDQKRKLWMWLIQTIISAITALAAAFGFTSCMG